MMPSPDFAEFVTWAFYGIVSGGVIIGVAILSRLYNSVSLLNVQVAVVIEKVVNHDKAIDHHSERISTLERKARWIN